LGATVLRRGFAAGALRLRGGNLGKVLLRACAARRRQYDKDGGRAPEAWCWAPSARAVMLLVLGLRIPAHGRLRRLAVPPKSMASRVAHRDRTDDAPRRRTAPRLGSHLARPSPLVTPAGRRQRYEAHCASTGPSPPRRAGAAPGAPWRLAGGGPQKAHTNMGIGGVEGCGILCARRTGPR